MVASYSVAARKQYGNNNRHCCFRFNVRKLEGGRDEVVEWLNLVSPPPVHQNASYATCINLHTMVDLA